MKGVKVTCSAGFLLLAAGLIYLDGVELFVQVLAACTLHEIGHCAAALSVGSRICALRLTAVGAEMRLSPAVSLSYARDAWIALAGPAVSLITAWIASQVGANLFAGLNLSFGLFNLLPIRPLDGGRILEDLLSCFLPEKAETILSGLSIVVSGTFLGLGCMAWSRWGNLTLFCTSVWLVAGMIRNQK